jgi:hypothetical protein
MKRKITELGILVLSLSLIGVGLVQAAETDTANVTLSAEIVSTATLTLSTTTITFVGHESPPTAMAASENGATVRATFRTASTAPATLKVLASGDLVNTVTATDKIPITALKSRATGASFFLAGPITWSSTDDGAEVGTGQSGDYTGAFTWALDNSWNYPTGTFTATAVYTLTSP